jgi:FkbM family methyltransferase
VRPLHETRAAKVARTKTLPVATRLRLFTLEARRQTHRRLKSVPIGFRRPQRLRVPDGVVWLDGAGIEIDYLTFCEIFVDEIFAARVTGCVVLDVGAHRGYYGAYALAGGAAAVYSYEPQSDNFATLERTAASHARSSDWVVECCAVGSRPRTADLHVSSESWSHSLYTPASGDIVGVEQVTVRPFPDVLADVQHREPGRPIVVKLNIEHAAGEVILGTPVRCWRTVQTLLFDYESGTREPLEDLLAHLKAAGMALRQGNGRNYRLERT